MIEAHVSPLQKAGLLDRRNLHRSHDFLSPKEISLEETTPTPLIQSATKFKKPIYAHRHAQSTTSKNTNTINYKKTRTSRPAGPQTDSKNTQIADTRR
eukprot:c27539_g1_i1 orf=7-300(-)